MTLGTPAILLCFCKFQTARVSLLGIHTIQGKPNSRSQDRHVSRGEQRVSTPGNVTADREHCQRLAEKLDIFDLERSRSPADSVNGDVLLTEMYTRSDLHLKVFQALLLLLRKGSDVRLNLFDIIDRLLRHLADDRFDLFLGESKRFRRPLVELFRVPEDGLVPILSNVVDDRGDDPLDVDLAGHVAGLVRGKRGRFFQVGGRHGEKVGSDVAVDQ